MSATDDLCFLPASTLAYEITTKRLSSVDLVDAFLARIAKFDQKFHSYLDVYEEEARQAAAAADEALGAGRVIGPFHGVPIAIKDLVEIAGHVTTGGSAQFRGRRSKATATIVDRLVASGMIILGKTHTVEFAYSGWGINEHMGTPWNPWDHFTQRTPGGSSSGSGVAVASGLAPWAIGTDTGGSVRLPASFCGLTALKPTIGSVPSDGIMPLSSTFDTPGPIARSALDTALLYKVIREPVSGCGLDKANSIDDVLQHFQRGLQGVRLARMPLVEHLGVDDEVLSAYERSLSVLAELGAEIVEVNLPFRFEDCVPAHRTIVHAEGYTSYADVLDDEDTILDRAVRAGMGMGREISARQYIMAHNERSELTRAMAKVFEPINALLTPTTETAALPLRTLDTTRPPSRFTRFVNTLGLCALALPNGATREGLPISLQIIAKANEEALALRIGYAYQQETDWHKRICPKMNELPAA
jgi:aspartyl-tRNA(Asn)/glutamyl-tRNA(Gln) amidotransferase subunit A